MATLVRTRSAVVRWWGSLRPSTSDAILYLVSGLFALLMGLSSSEVAQWHWGYLACIPFTLAGLVSLAGPRKSERSLRRWRTGVLAVTFLGVVVMPLALEIQWQPSQPVSVAQPEIHVIEHAGWSLAHGQTPWGTFTDSHGHVHNAQKNVPTFESFFPYFPLMGIFGLPSVANHELHGFSDARIAMSIFTCLLMLLALFLLRAPPDKKLRVAQVLVVLPTGSLFLATGGDDMPILALCLLSLVALQRRRTLATGIVLGVACAMKLTAWPFALAVLAVTRDREGRRDWTRVAATAGLIVAVTVAPFAILAPRGFLSNVIAFPLGLSGVDSPAASPLPGHILTTWWPPLRHVLLPVVFLVGSFITARWLRRSWPIDLPQALRALATMMTVVICAASATRLGYIIYPLNFALWAWVMTPEAPELDDRVVLVEAQRPSR